MALTDLMALARRPVPILEPVTAVTCDPLSTGYTVEAPKTDENRHPKEPVTGVTGVTATFVVDGVGEWAALANDSAPTVESEPDNCADEPPYPTSPSLPVIPLDDHVEQMAEAMLANRETAMRHLRGVARKLLSATGDPLARGLLLGWERHRPTVGVR
jgi:hypothetical protein